MNGGISLRDFAQGHLLGEGAFSKVYYAMSKIDRKEYVLKHIVHESGKGGEKILKREVTFLRELQHPNIIKFHGVITNTPGVITIIMEYFPGFDLYSYVECTDGLSESVAKILFLQIINALEHMHSNLIIHRDLKLENILINPRTKTIKLIDFGLSRRLEPYSFMSTPCGTYEYVPPEIIKNGEYIGPEVDIWALGCILYVMISAKYPWEGATEIQRMKNIIQAKYVPLTNVTPELMDLLTGILRVAPWDRLSLAQIYEHPWLHTAPLQPRETRLDENVLHQMEGLGFRRRDILLTLEQNYTYTAHSIIYHTLLHQKNRVLRVQSDTTSNYSTQSENINAVRRTHSDGVFRTLIGRIFSPRRRRRTNTVLPC